MSADFYFGVLIGALVLCIGLVLLLGTMGRRTRTEVDQVLIDLARQRNCIAEDHMRVVQRLTGWVGELVELMKDGETTSPLLGGVATGVARGCEDVPSGNPLGSGDVVSEAEARGLLEAAAAAGARVRAGSLLELALKDQGELTEEKP